MGELEKSISIVPFKVLIPSGRLANVNVNASKIGLFGSERSKNPEKFALPENVTPPLQ
jgi:hypothetical protein